MWVFNTKGSLIDNDWTEKYFYTTDFPEDEQCIGPKYIYYIFDKNKKCIKRYYDDGDEDEDANMGQVLLNNIINGSDGQLFKEGDVIHINGDCIYDSIKLTKGKWKGKI